MPLSHAAGSALEKAVELYRTIGYDTDENEQPVKNPTEDEAKRLRELLTAALSELKLKGKK